MVRKQQWISLIVGIALGSGSVGLLANNHLALKAAPKNNGMSNADFARDAADHLRKAHEDVDHLINAKSDQSAPGYADASEAKKAIDRATKALDRYVGLADAAKP